MNNNSFDQFIGGQFSWFTGVVEDIIDPQQMGRIRVRCFGYHTDDKSQIPTSSLPWALVMTPITSASMSGVGQSATGILQGSWVIGFFRDGPSAQDPIVLGTIPSISTGGDPTKGFSDPDNVNPKKPAQIDTPTEATGTFKSATSYVMRNDLKQNKIETAIPPKVSSVAVDNPDSYYTRKTWSNWDVSKVVNPTYPKNQVFHSEAGHVKEIDDSAGYERLFEMHKSGTYTEIDAIGNKTTTIVGKNYQVVLSDDNIYIKGNANLTVDGDFRHLVKGNYFLEVEGNKTEYIKGSRQSKVGLSDQTEIGQDMASNVKANRVSRVGGDTTIIRDGNKSETIGKNDSIMVSGNVSNITMGAFQQYVGSHLEVTTSGHLILVSSLDMSIETTNTLLISADQAVTQQYGSTLDITTGGAMTETIGGNQTVSISGNLAASSTGTLNIESSGNATLGSSGGQATVVAGGGNVVLSPSGQVIL